MAHPKPDSIPEGSTAASVTWTGPQGQRLVLCKVEKKDVADLLLLARSLSPAALYFRFGQHRDSGLSHEQVVSICDFDPEWATHWIVHCEGPTGIVPVANARYVVSPDRRRAEILLLVTDRWQKCGIGQRLVSQLVQSALVQGLSELFARVLPSNRPMQLFLEGQGFDLLDRKPAEPLVYLKKLA